MMAISCAILTVMLTACSSQPDTGAFTPPAIPVHATTAKIQDVPLHFESVGILKPIISVEIKPEVNGTLQSIHFTEGQFVKKGSLLFKIDPTSYLIKLQENEAQMAQNIATLELAQRKLERYNNLSNKEIITQQEWDELNFQVAKNIAQIRADESKISSAKLDVESCNITAPISGKIGKNSIHPGNLVNTAQSTPLITISNIDMLIVEFTLTEREFQQLTPEHCRGGHPIDICPFTCKEKIVHGALTFLDNTFDQKTGLILAQGKFANDKHQFLPGQHVQVRVPIQIKRNALVVPQKAVKINQQGPYVFVIKDDKTVEIHPVKLGDEIAENVVILEGLSQNEQIVTDGHLRLAPGLTVDIRPETPNL